jgi:hypothetical protein
MGGEFAFPDCFRLEARPAREVGAESRRKEGWRRRRGREGGTFPGADNYEKGCKWGWRGDRRADRQGC